MKLNHKNSDKLFLKARELIPGGIFGHYKYAVREDGPKFFSKAKDAYFWDVDGNKYLDLICGWGPMILGYNNPKIDQAARSQYDLGNTVSVASPVMIELAETLTDMIDIADWALFGKNGGDSTQLAVMVARAETGKSKILKINNGYHGANGWMQNSSNAGVIDSDSDEVLSVEWNSIKEFDETISAFKQASFEMAFIFKYSERKGTPAVSFNNHVPREVKEQRNQVLLSLLEKQSLKSNNLSIGKRFQILVESKAKRGVGKLMGRTRCNRKVIYDGENCEIGQMFNVQISSATPTTLFGEKI